MDYLQLRLPVGGDEYLHPYLHAGVRPHRRWYELVASHRHYPARKPYRAHPDAAQRPRGHALRHPLSGAGARVVRRPRRECAAVLRALVACGWFGIQTWLGGQAIFTMLQIVWPATKGSSAAMWACFFFFWALNMLVVWRGIDSIKFLDDVAAPFMLAVGLLLLWWITSLAGGFGPS